MLARERDIRHKTYKLVLEEEVCEEEVSEGVRVSEVCAELCAPMSKGSFELPTIVRLCLKVVFLLVLAIPFLPPIELFSVGSMLKQSIPDISAPIKNALLWLPLNAYKIKNPFHFTMKGMYSRNRVPPMPELWFGKDALARVRPPPSTPSFGSNLFDAASLRPSQLASDAADWLTDAHRALRDSILERQRPSDGARLIGFVLAGLVVLTILAIVGSVLCRSRRRQQRASEDFFDESPAGVSDHHDSPSQTYPDGYVFCSNHVSSMAELRKLQQETEEKQLKELFRSEEWRAHVRMRGKSTENYNWQLRQSMAASQSPSR